MTTSCSRSGRRRDRPALIFPEGTLSYGQLERAASAIAADLREGSRVAVWGASALETCVAMVAVLAAGAVAVPLNPRSGARELAHMLSDWGPELVLVPPGAETPVSSRTSAFARCSWRSTPSESRRVRSRRMVQA